MVRRFGLVLIVIAAAGACMGCVGASSTWAYPHAGTETLGQTPDEHRQQVARALDVDQRALVEDLDLLFMTDRPTRLTRWHGR